MIFLIEDSKIFPDTSLAEADGLLAIGGDLGIEMLLNAYRSGIFPYFEFAGEIYWFAPDPRFVLIPKDYRKPKGLDKVIKSGKFELRIDSCFDKVIKNCAGVKRKTQENTWISETFIRAYIDLYNEGYAHSFETFYEGELAGGLYGVSLGRAFFGESMFYLKSDASRFAFFHLVEFCLKNKIHFIDSQLATTHLLSAGALNIERKKYNLMLAKALKYHTIKGRWGL
ncbi:MAG: leucyl/phenylalanyl-tRNA--protein transferase [Bacteroidales bacterium]|nr:leucyl/phenylalanyl-tRNA--protein transferase [Bacteroidales bacterium]